jgi:phage terminase large subunit GpA-like protein
VNAAALIAPPAIGSARALFRRVMGAWKPPKIQKLSDWADEKFYLSAESAAEPGRWHTIPYQRGIMDAMSDPDIEFVWVMKSARVGWTKIINAKIASHADQDPCAILLVQPTVEDAEGYSKEEIAPMIRDVPCLRDKFADVRAKDGDNTILSKSFPGGLLSMTGANSGRGFRRVSRRIVLFDEIDGYPPSAGSEGDQIRLGIKRTDYFWNRKVGGGSTPLIRGASRIETLFESGDQRRYYVPCPHCHAFQVLVFRQFRWPKDRPEAAVYVCEECGGEIEYAQQRYMVERGEWRPGPHAQFPEVPSPQAFHGVATFHIWAAYSYAPNATWGQLCSEFVAAQKEGPDALKTFINTVLGETWQEQGEAPDWERLHARCEQWEPGTCPDGVLFLTAGVDVQRDRLVYEVVGWGRGKRSWSIDYGVIAGNTSNLDDPSWAQLDALLNRSFRSTSSVEMSIARMAVDAGDQAQIVYNWCRRKPLSRVIAIRGNDKTNSVLVGSPSPVDINVNGRKLKRGYKVWPVAGNVAKSELYGFLKLKATDEAGEPIPAPQGYCYFPIREAEFFKQLTAEQLVPRKKRNGFMQLKWEPIPGRQNHALDCRVYARAAAAVVGLDRFGERDWSALESMAGQSRLASTPVNGDTRSADAPQTAPVSPPANTTGPRQSAARRQPWITRRDGGWLTRR